MATNECGVSPVTDIGAQCSGNGACVLNLELNRSLCACNEGWTGESDFQVTNSFLDCQINVVLIQVLWGVYLFFHLVFYLTSIQKLRWLWDKHSRIVATNRAAGKKYTIFNNKGLLSLMPFMTVGWLCQLVYAITKIADQNHKLGGSVFLTIMYIFWRAAFYFCADTFNPSLLASLLRAQRNLDHVISLNNRLSFFHLVMINLVSITTIIPLVVSEDPFYPIVGMVSVTVFYWSSSLAMLFFGIQCAYISKKVEHILDESYIVSKDQRTKRIKEKITHFQSSSSKQGFVQFLIYGTFGGLPYLWNKHDYLLPFAWLAVLFTIRKCIIALVQEEEDMSSRRGKRGESLPEGSGENTSGATVKTEKNNQVAPAAQ